MNWKKINPQIQLLDVGQSNMQEKRIWALLGLGDKDRHSFNFTLFPHTEKITIQGGEI